MLTPPATSSANTENMITIVVPRSGSTTISTAIAPRRPAAAGARRPSERARCGLRREQQRRVEHQRQLRDLGRLHLERPGAEPAPSSR